MLVATVLSSNPGTGTWTSFVPLKSIHSMGTLLEKYSVIPNRLSKPAKFLIEIKNFKWKKTPEN